MTSKKTSASKPTRARRTAKSSGAKPASAKKTIGQARPAVREKVLAPDRMPAGAVSGESRVSTIAPVTGTTLARARANFAALRKQLGPRSRNSAGKRDKRFDDALNRLEESYRHLLRDF